MDTNARDRFETDAATGAVGNTPMEAWPANAASKEGQTPDAKKHNPGTPAHTAEDPGWHPEAQGSPLAQEREGVPKGDVPQNLPDSAARERRKA